MAHHRNEKSPAAENKRRSAAVLITAVWAVAYLNTNTAYVQIPALRATLAEKHITKILKCFIISAAPCTCAT